MDKETIAQMILDSGVDLPDDPPPITETDSENDLAHYGVLGMKWGVRKDRRKKGETDSQYKSRMEREHRERTQAAELKARADQQKRELKARANEQKRTLKEQAKREKRVLKSQEKERERQYKKDLERQKAEQKRVNKKTASQNNKGDNARSARSMSDQELQDAINRIRKEKEYEQLIRKPDGLMKKTMKSAAAIGGGVLVASGKALATQYVTAYGKQKINKALDRNWAKKHNIVSVIADPNQLAEEEQWWKKK